MEWRRIGFLFALSCIALLIVYGIQRHQQERSLLAARASLSAVPLFIGVTPPAPLHFLADGCAAVPANLHVLGLAVTVSQMDAMPLGRESAWRVLRQRAMAGDLVRWYGTKSSGAPEGGYLLLRGPCLLAQVRTWNRFAMDRID